MKVNSSERFLRLPTGSTGSGTERSVPPGDLWATRQCRWFTPGMAISTASWF
jgi:hypothetical protein